VHLSHSDTPEGLKRAIEGRIQALANVHRLFVETRWAGADVRNIVAQELSPYCREGDERARIEGPNLMVEPSVAQAIAVTVHELSTNAAKYGALSVADGRVQIEWSRLPDDRFALRWTESNGPPVQPPASRLRHACDGDHDFRSTARRDQLRVAPARTHLRNHHAGLSELTDRPLGDAAGVETQLRRSRSLAGRLSSHCDEQIWTR
jgi:Signal transduction histidine kinase